jgi:tetratricopeptide (TPR) repeat protein
MDDESVAWLARALAAARDGQLEEACRIGDRALADGGDPGALNAMLGMFRLKLGLDEVAVQHLEIAREIHPADVRIATNLASALSRIGQMERAFAVASLELAMTDRSLQLLRLRGFVADQLGRFDDAAEALEQVVRNAPRDWPSWNNLGNARLAAGNITGAIAALAEAVALEPAAGRLRVNLALAHKGAGNYVEAEAQLRRAIDEFPDESHPLIVLHNLLSEQRRGSEIGPILDRALVLRPDDVELLLARARNRGSLLQMDEAEHAFREVLVHSPANADAFVGLAVIYEHSRPSALEDLLSEAEHAAIEGNSLNLVRAFVYRRAKRYQDGVASIDAIDPSFEPARREHLLGQMLVGLGEHERAFAAFERMNAVYRNDPSRPLDRAQKLHERLRAELDRTTSEWLSTWEAPPVEPEQPAPIFLVGFPRSGTTLLDTILMGHPELEVMEERPVMARLKDELGGFDAIAGLNEDGIRSAQRRYFDIAGDYVQLPPGARLVDKSPLLLNEAALIYRLFPNARFIFVIRHPADVLLSCFMSSFNLNDAMSNFLRLDCAASFYDLTMRVWENSRALLPLSVHAIVYEEMVEEPERVLRRLLEDLDLNWHDELLDHTRTAVKRGLITTASYAQVTEPIYRRSVGRWRNYCAELGPILPALQPWAAKFGYSCEGVGRNAADHLL